MTDDKKPADVPYIAFEAVTARFERTIKRLIICLAISIVLLFASNIAWLYYTSMYDYSGEDITATQDGQGVNVVGGGDLSNVATSIYKDKEKDAEK